MHEFPLNQLRLSPLLIVVGILVILGGRLEAHAVQTKPTTGGTDVKLKIALEAAGENRPEIERALREVSRRRGNAMRWLITRMPATDLRTISADHLLENHRLAYEAMETAPWRHVVPEEVFRQGVLPYAVVDERRDDWRASFRERFLPLVADARTSGEAAVMLNQKIFKDLGVVYSTKRPKANQSGLESIEAGMASCTGLSVLLIEACRSVGVPARFVGVPLWADGSGNHSWVEVWDNGRWRYTGAAEPTGDQLDKGWFSGRAADAVADDPKRAVWAVRWGRFGRHDEDIAAFPMVWSPEDDSVFAVNVTDRYTRDRVDLPEGIGRLYVRIVDDEKRRRLSVPTTLLIDGEERGRGLTRGDENDANDHLEFRVPFGSQVTIRFETPEGPLEMTRLFTRDEQIFDGSVPLRFDRRRKTASSSALADFDRQMSQGASFEEIAASEHAGVGLSRAEAAEVANRLVDDRAERIRRDRTAEHEARILTLGDLEMPFWYEVHGEPPADEGRALFISMHGGGGAPKAVNDQQWENQKRLYVPEEGVYLVPRAPTDTWNLWHRRHIDEFFSRLIENLIVFEGVDPDKVYLMGYSAGGDGVYQLAPRMADRFAAASMMAGHPNETKPDGLYNLPFTLHMGGEDTAYRRNEIAREWKATLAELAAQDGGYPHEVVVHEGKGHWMDREDAVAVPWMARHGRDLRPERIVWLQDDVTHDRFYWLAVDDPKGRERIVVERDGNTVTIVEGGERGLRIRVDDDMFDLDRAITVKRGEDVVFQGAVPRTIAAIATTLGERGDPVGVFTGEIVIPAVE